MKKLLLFSLLIVGFSLFPNISSAGYYDCGLSTVSWCSYPGNNATLHLETAFPPYFYCQYAYGVNCTIAQDGTSQQDYYGRYFWCSCTYVENGACGTANSVAYANGSTGYSPKTQCTDGSPSTTAFPTAGNTVSWTCSGTGGGAASPTCSASQAAVNNASCTSLTAPATVPAGSTFAASVTMLNNGSKTWSPGANYNLGSQSLQDNTTWGTNRHASPATVTPSNSTTINFNSTAPATPGTYPFSWKMVQDGVEWFGDTCSQNITVTVATPATLTATPVAACGSGRVDLSWSAVAGATGYDTQIDGGAWTNRNNVTSYAYIGLGNSTTHSFAVRAWNGAGAGGGRASSPASVTTAVVCATGTWTAPTCPASCGAAASNPPYTCVGGNGICSINTPATLACAATTACTSASIIGTCPAPGTTATVSWTASAGATYYALRVDNQADSWDSSCTSAKGDFCENVVSTSKVFTGTVSNGYTTWVHACNGTGCSLPVATSFTCIPPVPGAPATLSATPVAACGSGRVDLSWSAVTGATGYDTQIDGGVWTNRNNVTSYAYTGLGNSTAHTFAVRAWNGTGAGAGRASTPSPVTTAVVCPTGTWTAPTCPASCGAAASNPPYTCVGGNGICSVNTPATRACPATAVCIPGAPANVTATPAPVCSTGKVDLSWSAVAGATGYDTQVDGTWSTDRGNVTSYTYTGLGNNAAHSFAVRAWNVSGAGAGTASTPASVTTAVQCMASISANPTLVQVGSTTNITWATAGYGNCSVAGGSDVWTALSDTRTSSPITGATIYQLTCDGAPKANVEVKVPTPPEITAEYGTITSRGNKRLLVPLNSEVTLKWKLNGQTGCIITKAPVAHPAATKGLSIADMSAGWTKLIVTGNSVYTILCTSLLDEKVTVEILSGGFESE